MNGPTVRGSYAGTDVTDTFGSVIVDAGLRAAIACKDIAPLSTEQTYVL